MAELGALSLRIQEEGADATLAAVKRVDESAKKVALTEKQLQKEISESTRLWALQARTADLSNSPIVASLKKTAAAQFEWLRALGASDAQLLRHAANVQSFQRRLESATAAQAGQTRALTLFGQEVTASSGRLSAFSTRTITGMNAAAFALSSFASGGAVNFRTLASAAAGFAAFFGPGGAIASIAITGGLALTDFFTRARREIEETRKKAVDELGKLDQALEGARRSRDPQSLQIKLQDDIREKREKEIEQAAILHRAEHARTEEEKARLIVVQARLKELEKEIEITDRAIRNPAQVIGPKGIPFKPIEVRDAAAAEKQRQEQITKTVDALAKLAQLDALTGDDLQKITALEKELNAELRRGNVDRTRRVEILEQLIKLDTAGTLSTGNLTPRPLAAPRIDATKFNERIRQLNAAGTGISESERQRLLDQLNFEQGIADGLANAIAGGITAGFARGLQRGGIKGGLKEMSSQILGGMGSVFMEVAAEALKGAILTGNFFKSLIANPLAAAGAAIALSVLGAKLGGRGTGATGSGGFYGGGSATATLPSSFSRLIVDPNADRGAHRMASINTSGLTDRPVQIINVIGHTTPQGQEMIGESYGMYSARRA